MKEGKQQRQFKIKIEQQSGKVKTLVTHNVMSASGVFSHEDLNDLIQSLAEYTVEVASSDPVINVEQSAGPIDANGIITVPTRMLRGIALDYAVAEVLGWKDPYHSKSDIFLLEGDVPALVYIVTEEDGDVISTSWSPSSSIEQAGYLMKKFKVAVAPTTREVESPIIKGSYSVSDYSGALEYSGSTYEETICMAIVLGHNQNFTNIPADFDQYLAAPQPQ